MVCGLCAGHMSSATFVLSLQQSERQILLSGRRCWRTWSPSNGWCSRMEAEFEDVCKKYKRHYLQQELTDVERKLVMDFVEYFLAQWGPGSHASKWYAGAHPFSLTNNQVESDLQRIFGELFFHFFSQPGYGRQPQGNKGQPHVPDRASAWPIHPSTRAAGKFLSSLLEPQIKTIIFRFSSVLPPVCVVKCLVKSRGTDDTFLRSVHLIKFGDVYLIFTFTFRFCLSFLQYAFASVWSNHVELTIPFYIPCTFSIFIPPSLIFLHANVQINYFLIFLLFFTMNLQMVLQFIGFK